MRQIVRRVIDRKGKVAIIDLPEPHLGPDQVLVQSHYSLISTGTEMSTLKKTPVELVKQTISDPWMRHVVKQTIFATGVAQTGQRVWQEMIMPREIGYSGAGRVLAVGENVEGYEVGDKVAYASTGHAETTAPYVNHVVPVPEAVDLRHAAFVTVGGIALQSIRRADVELGEVVAIYGLGLVGQLCAQLAKAAGCVVVGIDLSDARNELATQCGVDLVINPSKEDVQRRIMDFTGKNGADATVICAASSSDEIINSSMEITRKQGRVVIVGYVNLNVHPKNFLYKEIDLRYSRAYGPGSYHRAYEKGRLDYPFGYVRWTENRNLGEIIRLVGSGSLELEPLIGGVFSMERANEAFDALQTGSLPSVAALIEYDTESGPDRRKTIDVRPRQRVSGKVGISIVGCGNHVLGKHLPNLKKLPDVDLRGLVSATGKNASMVAERVGATVITTELDEVLNDDGTDALMVCSAQPAHAEHILAGIEAGRALFVEKPLVTKLGDFAQIARKMVDNPVMLTLGLNRRYSPLVTKMRDAMPDGADVVQYIITQPYLPPDHWTVDEIDGGGRLITEGEHFIDICHSLIGREPIGVFARALGDVPEDIRTLVNYDITIHYEGAVAHVTFNESGSAGYPREQVTAFSKGQVAVLDDFSKLTVFGKGKPKKHGLGVGKEMGHQEALNEFIAALKGRPNQMLSWDEAFNATLCMFAAQESIRSGEPIDLRQFRAALLATESA